MGPYVDPFRGALRAPWVRTWTFSGGLMGSLCLVGVAQRTTLCRSIFIATLVPWRRVSTMEWHAVGVHEGSINAVHITRSAAGPHRLQGSQ